MIKYDVWNISEKQTKCAYVADLKILPHEEVEGGAGVGADGADAAATAPQQPQAKVCTLLCLLLKQQLWELHTHNTHTLE